MSTNTKANYPAIYAEEPTLRVAVVYNPFDLSDIVIEKLVYDQDKTLADYLEGLPTEVTWIVGYEGQAVEQDQWATIKPRPFSTLSLVRVPEGGNSGKTILRIAALIAVVVAATLIAGPAGAALATQFGGSAAAWTAAATAALTTVGATIVSALIPPGGTTAQADSRTYGADGPKNTATEGMPIPRTYGMFRIGGNIVDCFTKNIGSDQYLYMRTAVNDGLVEDITDIELNNQPIAYYNNQASTAGQDGPIVQSRVHKGDVEQEVNDWFSEAIRLIPRSAKLAMAETIIRTSSEVDKVRLDILFPYGLYFAKSDGRKVEQHLTLNIQYRKVDDHGNPLNGWAALPLASDEDGLTTNLYISDTTDQPKRLTYQSTQLDRGFYEVQINRDKDSETGTSSNTECYLQDFGEIDVNNVNLNGVATVSLKIKMSSQISGIPTITALVKGSHVNIYDDDGNVTSTAWTDNPAYVCADILTNPVQGAGYDRSRIVWGSLNEFADFCAAKGLKFNGAYDQVRSLWDSVIQAAKVGRGTVYPRGTKLAFLYDDVSEPVMLFGPGNIIKGSFKKTWVSLTDRANEVTLQFQDADDSYKQKNVRVTNPDAIGRGEIIKPANLDGFGVTNIDQATATAEFFARQNSYIRQMIDIDAPLEAIGINVGEVALIQHDSINFANGCAGRLKAGSTTTVINLDRPATIQGACSLLVLHSAVHRSSGAVISKVGNRVGISGLPANIARITRLIQGSIDREIVSVTAAGSNYYLTLDDASDIALAPADVWDTDVIEEAPVLSASADGMTLTVSQPFSQAPAIYSNFMFGQQTNVRLPFRLKKVRGQGIETRTLSFVQYDERVYEPGSWGSVVISKPVVDIGQALSLTAAYDSNPKPDQERIPVTIEWQRPSTGVYGGADVYYALNGGAFKILASVQNVTSLVRDFSRGDGVAFMVVAYDDHENRAPLASAPTFTLNVDAFALGLDAPTNFAVGAPVWLNDATLNFSWTAPTTFIPDSYRLERFVLDQTSFAALPADPAALATAFTGEAGWAVVAQTAGLTASVDHLDVGYFLFRLRDEKGFSASDWDYLPFHLQAPDIPVSVTNLALVGSAGIFSGPDATWTWDDIVTQAVATTLKGLTVYWQDYRVRIIDPVSNAVLRTEYTTSPTYTYTMTKNLADSAGGLPRRGVTIEVTIRGKQGQLSTPATSTGNNPPPAAPTNVQALEDVNAMLVSWDPNRDADYAGTVVWIGAQAGFAPTPDKIGFRGSASNARLTVATGQDWYVIVGHYDSFDPTPVNLSAPAHAFIPTIAIADLQAAAQIGTNLQDAVQTAVDSLGFPDTDALVTGTLQVALQGYKDKVSTANLDKLQTQARGTDIENLNSQIDSDTEQTAASIALLVTKTNDNQSAIFNEQTARTTADSATASSLYSLGVSVGQNSAAIVTEQNVRATADGAEATARTTLAVTVGQTSAAITAEAITRANADSATAQTISLIGVKNGDNSAFILNQNTTYLDANTSMAGFVQGVNAIYGRSTAYADASVNTVAGPNSALAQSVNTLGIKVGGTGPNGTGGLFGNVTQLSQVMFGLDGVTGIYAKSSLSLDVNGHVTGYVANNDGKRGTFVVVADYFAIVDPSGTTTQVPFAVQGGQVYMHNVIVDTLQVGSATKHGFGGGGGVYLHVGGGTTEVAVMDYVAGGGEILMTLLLGFGTPSGHVSSDGTGCTVYLYCDGALVQSYDYRFAGDYNDEPSWWAKHQPAPGNRHYSLRIAANGGVDCVLNSSQMAIQEMIA